MRKFFTLTDKILMRIPSVALAIVFGVSLSVAAGSGCQSTFTPSQLASFQKTCAAARTGYTVFSTLKETGRFSDQTIRRVDAAWAGVNSVCVNPPPDVSTAAVQVAAALVIITKAIDNG